MKYRMTEKIINRMHIIPEVFVIGRKKTIILVLLSFMLATCNQSKPEKYNVLMICVDDLRPALGCYGNDVISSPNIDAFAANACRFENHYVQAAACGPSRGMLLNGKFTKSWDAWKEQRELEKEPSYPVALPHLFKQKGYTTVCIGKVSHEPGGVMDEAQKIPQIPFSWDTTYTTTGKWETPWNAFFAYASGEAQNLLLLDDNPKLMPYECGEVGDEGYPDGQNAREAMKQLRRLKDNETPFLLAMGFYKPHLPFNVPAEYCQYYDKDAIPLASNNYPPKNIKEELSLHNSFEVTTHYYWPDGPGNIPPEQAKELKYHYFACVSYIDRQIGMILDELKRLELDDNTIVVLWSDHGWHLGEHGMFGKQTNFSIATRSPLIVRIPKMTDGGKVVGGLVETLDIYPTLAELCGFTPPQDLQGKSFLPLIKNTENPGKPYARSFFHRNETLGKTIVTDRYRIVQWKNEQDTTVALELYDHRTDPEENINIAYDTPEITDSLLTVLNQAVFFEDIGYTSPDTSKYLSQPGQ